MKGSIDEGVRSAVDGSSIGISKVLAAGFAGEAHTCGSNLLIRYANPLVTESPPIWLLP